MPTIGSITKTVRINPTDLQVIEDIMRGGTTWSGAIHELCRGYTQKTSEGTPKKIVVETPHNECGIEQKVVDDISEMLCFMGTDLKEFMRAIDDTLIAGELDLVDGKIKSVHQDINLDRFLEACHDLNLDPQKTLEKLTETLFRTR